jgi:hypothetical protein
VRAKHPKLKERWFDGVSDPFLIYRQRFHCGEAELGDKEATSRAGLAVDAPHVMIDKDAMRKHYDSRTGGVDPDRAPKYSEVELARHVAAAVKREREEGAKKLEADVAKRKRLEEAVGHYIDGKLTEAELKKFVPDSKQTADGPSDMAIDGDDTSRRTPHFTAALSHGDEHRTGLAATLTATFDHSNLKECIHDAALVRGIPSPQDLTFKLFLVYADSKTPLNDTVDGVVPCLSIQRTAVITDHRFELLGTFDQLKRPKLTRPPKKRITVSVRLALGPGKGFEDLMETAYSEPFTIKTKPQNSTEGTSTPG